ncbi:phasin family protein [Sphingomonas abietis]|uniref:Phasin family protein n=1 Tax=Sphingomonas abietis TaxID=3012344 RepID=A0ABY7NN81_9SPHN|nr:phasin family protein [Sphingomonas abietis]WBO22803.1 phasin family protein [Sphingomonas abietis]
MVEKTGQPTRATPPKRVSSERAKAATVARTPEAKAAAPTAKPVPATAAAPTPAGTAKPVTAAAGPPPAAPAIQSAAAAPAPKPAAAAAKTETPTVAKPAPVAAKPVPVAPKIKSAPVAPAPAPKPVEVAAVKVEDKVGVPAPQPVAKTPIAKAMTKQAAAPIAVITEGSTIMNDTVTKVQETAKKFTADAGQKMQALFGDASERAKGAYEKSVKLSEEFTEFQKGNVEAIVESGKLAAKAAESLGQEAADYARKSFESGTAAFKTFASAKSPTELFKLQSDYMKSYFESAVAESTKVTEAWLKLAGDVVQPISNRVAVAVEKAKTTSAF